MAHRTNNARLTLNTNTNQTIFHTCFIVVVTKRHTHTQMKESLKDFPSNFGLMMQIFKATNGKLPIVLSEYAHAHSLALLSGLDMPNGKLPIDVYSN